jgi:hypothetical protein
MFRDFEKRFLFLILAILVIVVLETIVSPGAGGGVKVNFSQGEKR